MCDTAPVISSVTLGGSPLTEGTHYSLNYATGPPSCSLTLTLLDAAGPIGPNEHLIVSYQLELDANTQNGATLTNVAGATEWFNGDSTVANRQPYTRTVTNGTVGTADHQDAHTVSVAITGFFFEKTVANLTTGASPTTTAAAGHTLRYTLRLASADEPFTNVRIHDELDALNAQAAFVPGTLTLVSYPPGADVSNTSSTGGAKGTGVIDIRNLNVAQGGAIQIQFDVTLAASVPVGTVVTNQSALRLANNTLRALSDDPNVNGPADPDVAGDEDPTRVTIVPTSLTFEKTVTNVTSGASPAAEASPGDRLRYRLRLVNQSNFALSGYSLRDEIDRLNPAAAFAPGTLTVVTVPAGANAGNTTATGGAKGTGRARRTRFHDRGVRRYGSDRVRGHAGACDREWHLRAEPVAIADERHRRCTERRSERKRCCRSERRGRRGPDPHPHRVRTGVPGPEDIDGPDRRPSRPAGR
jgi:hypothetical protein